MNAFGKFEHHLKDEIVINLESREISLNDLHHLLSVLQNNMHIGHVIFPKEVKRNLNFQDILIEINKQIILNNRIFDTYTDDLTLCLLTKLTYEYKNNKKRKHTNDDVHPKDLEYFQMQPDWHPLKEKGWQVKKVLNFLETNHNLEHACIVYMNKKRCQIVAVFQGVKLDPFVFLEKNYGSDALISTFYSTESALDIIEEIIELKSETDYHLSFSGYSFGALLAEASVLLYEIKCKMNDVRATTFDSPGSFFVLKSFDSDSQFKLESLDIVTYLSGFDALNTLNPHVGKMKLFFYDDKYPNNEKDKQMFLNNFLNFNIRELNRSKYPVCEDGFQIESDCSEFKSLVSVGLSSTLKNLQNESHQAITVVDSKKTLKPNAVDQNLIVKIPENQKLENHIIVTVNELITALIEMRHNGKKYELKIKDELEDQLQTHYYHNIDYYLRKLSKMNQLDLNYDSSGEKLDLLSKQLSLLRDIYEVKSYSSNDTKVYEIFSKQKENTIDRIRSRLYRLLYIEKKLNLNTLSKKVKNNDKSKFFFNLASTILNINS